MAEHTPTARPNPRPDLNFTPVRNGMDYLARAVDDLTERAGAPSESDLKYAVLHLQAATEVLLKARLVGEHWSLVFKNPGSATLEDFKKGKFDSCTIEATMDRLENIAQVKISAEGRSAIKVLAEDRNALTHYGHTANAFQVEARAARVLSFLLDFITEQLYPMLHAEYNDAINEVFVRYPTSLLTRDVQLEDPAVQAALQQQREVDVTMRALRSKLRRVDKLVEKRMQDLSGGLASLEHRTARCPDCLQWAFVVNDDSNWSPIKCRFCLAVYHQIHEAAIAYARRVTGMVDKTQICPNCGAAHTMVIGAKTADRRRPGGVVEAICFNCGCHVPQIATKELWTTDPYRPHVADGEEQP
ncbi:hypothetical protein ACFP51_20600 [Streptomyces pratens]|uniref:Uncharacterized protein n=1 Tax=Streptomyces pratens TaxID=887456 RepID=A0ABW1M9A9_9ACTN